MSGIFGYARIDDATGRAGDPQALLPAMAAAMAHWGPDGGGLWQDGCCSLGQRLLFNSPESVYEHLPRWVEEAGLAFTAEARIDNRDELCDRLAVPHADRPTTPDSELMLRAYLHWGEACPDHLLGDWSMAVWHPEERKLFLARDHHGNTGLFYWQHAGGIAFASAPEALYAMGAPKRLNELYLAQLLVSWFAYHGPQTIHLDIQRLPPAHAMVVTPQGTCSWRYWRLEDTPELHLPSLEDYAQGLLEVYDEAVRCRLRSYRPVGVTLSGGLDSGSVTALAGRALGRQGRRLAAFTAAPLYDTAAAVGPDRFGDETALAAATAAFCGNVDQHLVDSAQVTPLAGIRRGLAVLQAPTHAAGNQFWILDLLDQARALGLGALLTGQGGNATVSWTGAPELRSTLAAWRVGGWKAGLRRSLPPWALRPLLRLRYRRLDWSGTAIAPDFARRMELAPRRLAAIGHDISLAESWRRPEDMRHAIILPGATHLGDLWSRQGAAAGLEVRDPTVDKRVMAYTLAVPDAVFGPQDGLDRRLLRSALAGLLPDAVRLNQQRGRQAADLRGRLLAGREEVEAALETMTAPPAAAYVDASKMRRAWADLQEQATPSATHRAGTILLRGLMAGLFLSQA